MVVHSTWYPSPNYNPLPQVKITWVKMKPFCIGHTHARFWLCLEMKGVMSFEGIPLKVPNWWNILLKSRETSTWSAETKLWKQKVVIYQKTLKEDLWWMTSSAVPGTSGPWLVQLLQDLISWGAKVFSPPLDSFMVILAKQASKLPPPNLRA